MVVRVGSKRVVCGKKVCKDCPSIGMAVEIERLKAELEKIKQERKRTKNN
jgi:hypothetical protein